MERTRPRSRHRRIPEHDELVLGGHGRVAGVTGAGDRGREIVADGAQDRVAEGAGSSDRFQPRGPVVAAC